MAYNEANGITPRSVAKKVADIIEIGKKEKGEKKEKLSPLERQRLIERYTAEMQEASRTLEFEKAAFLRDRIRELRQEK